MAAPKDTGSSHQATDKPADTSAQLQHLKASATKEYSLKNYVVAADFYSEATELQAELNGEMSPENADLLYAYGRCLYHVAVSQSDVLGGKVASEGPRKKKRKTAAADKGSNVLKSNEDKTAEETLEAVVEEKQGPTNGAQASKAGEKDNKPFFQITGDENWTDSEDEADDTADGQDGEEVEEEEDDFAIAYEILDIARVLLSRQLEELDKKEQEVNGKGKATQSSTLSPERRAITERLADTHDLQAEISLENERFADAVTDSRSALELKLKLFPQESSLIAEAHYKLSLALEFSSVTTVDPEGEGSADKAAQVDEEARKEAATHMESAIASCRLRVEKEKEAAASLLAEGAKKEKEKSIKDVQEMVTDMEQRLLDLRNPAVSVNGLTGPAGAPDGSDPMAGILGSLLGETTAQKKARIEEATKGANDLTGMVRHKKPKAAAATLEAASTQSGGPAKRKLEDDEDGLINGKKAKIENGAKD